MPDLEPADSRGSLVDAKMCGNGHPNPPTVGHVRGVRRVPRARFVVGRCTSRGRASAVCSSTTASVVELDHELLIGRNPDRDTRSGPPGPAAASSCSGDKVSRSHLEVRFQGWEVLVADCGSTNGTFVVPHPGGQVVALEPGRPQMVEPGATVYFGSRSFTVLGRRA